MKQQTLHVVIAAVACLFVTRACVDKDYDLGELDKEAVINIPPVPVGSVDTAWFKSNLVEIEIPGLPGTLALEYLVEGLFTEEVAEKFFFEGAGDISLEGKLNVFITGINADANITARLNIIDRQGENINAILIDDSQVKNKTIQDFVLHIDSEYTPYMADADGIKITFIFEGLENITLDRDDFLVLDNLVLKTGGMHVNL
ncbi:MAG: hypothetical protein LBF09_01755 [Odoribacteraceae bacterium]|jgi:hypothetical protein|nr:hypothetical protein [Odoribacteraceae bacterium]